MSEIKQTLTDGAVLITELIPKFLKVIESEPPYPDKQPYPDEPLPPKKSGDDQTDFYRSYVYDSDWMIWKRKCDQIDAEHLRIIRTWVYATDVKTDSPLPIGQVLKVIRTGETVIVGNDCLLIRGFGMALPSLIKEGDELLVCGPVNG